AGASLRDVVRVTYILPETKDFPQCWPILKKYLGDVRPAATMISAGLADPRVRIEIEGTAHRHARPERRPTMTTHDRRQFSRILAAGGAAAGMGLLFPSASPRAAAEGATEALLLSCMDYRLTDQTTRYMSGRGLRDKYDHVILAGA